MVWHCFPTTIRTESSIFQLMKTPTTHRKRLHGFSLIEMAIVLLVLRAISRIGIWSRKCQRLMLLNITTLITPVAPAQIMSMTVSIRGSNLDAIYCARWVSFRCNSTNSYIETLNGSFRDECLNLHWFKSLEEAKAIIEAWRQNYNENRTHMALNDQMPHEFARNIGLIGDTKVSCNAEN